MTYPVALSSLPQYSPDSVSTFFYWVGQLVYTELCELSEKIKSFSGPHEPRPEKGVK